MADPVAADPADCAPENAADAAASLSVASGRPPDSTPTDFSPAARSSGWRLSAAPVSVPTMRRGLRAVLEDTGLSQDELYDLLVAACEAAANAIDHAQEPTEPFVDVLFEMGDGQVTIVVRDHGRWRNGPTAPHRGRGLAMMSALAETTVEAHPHGTTVTLRSRRNDGPPAGMGTGTG